MARSWLAAAAAGILALWLGMTSTLAGEAQPDFATWLAGVRSDALAHGIKAETLDQALGGIAPIDRVLELDRKQPEFTLTFDQYEGHVVSPGRVASGREQMALHKALLSAIAKRYGVPPRVIVAMWGIETDYGRLTGGFSVIPALATLAYDGRRSQYFRGELMNALEIIDKGVPASRLRGSWAGAMGQCQFMPSTYLKYARAWNRGGIPDIWANQADVFASAANYLAQLGWNGRQGWGRAVTLPGNGLDPQMFGLETHKSLTQWRRLGIRMANGKPLPARGDIQASLVRAETGKGDDVGHGQPYLVYDNFHVLMKWNRSLFFGLAAGTLADRLGAK